jgi:chaperonin cofactor prefoldin
MSTLPTHAEYEERLRLLEKQEELLIRVQSLEDKVNSENDNFKRLEAEFLGAIARIEGGSDQMSNLRPLKMAELAQQMQQFREEFLKRVQVYNSQFQVLKKEVKELDDALEEIDATKKGATEKGARKEEGAGSK